jgi:CRP-like cAMP-binding protein
MWPTGRGPPGASGNGLIDLLGTDERKRFLARTTRRHLVAREVISEPARTLVHVLFPVGAVISLITTMSDGSAAEVAMVGREGMVGMPVFLGNHTLGNVRAVTQVPGDALAMGVRDLRRAVPGKGRLSDVLDGYANALLAQAAQEVACARLHSLEQRFTRFLLMTSDRAGVEEFPLTHDFLSDLLGVRRPSVSVAANALQVAGLIQYPRGSLTILDVPGLRASTCECYSLITAAFGRIKSEAEDPE